MLSQLWLLTILAPLTLAVPVPQDSVTPSATFSYRPFQAQVTNAPKRLGLNRANNQANRKTWNLKAGNANVGSKTTLFEKASGVDPPSSLNTGTSGGVSGGTSDGTSDGTSSNGGVSKALKVGA